MERDTLGRLCTALDCISTHTLTWSVTEEEYIVKLSEVDFNSHAHVERDVSIIKMRSGFSDFNSHAHVERDLIAVVGMVAVEVFQLTRSRGA